MSDDKLAVPQQKTREWMEHPDRLGELAKCLPPPMTPESFMRAVMTTHLRVPKLYETTLESRWLAIVTAAQLGLPFDGRMAHLVPFGSTAQLIVDYKGLIQAAYKHPRVLAISAEVRCKNDPFRMLLGTSQKIEHEYGEPRGDVVGVYATALIRGGGKPFVYLDHDEIERHREFSRNKDTWREHYDAMAKKTAVKQLAKFIPQSAQLTMALGHEEAPEEDRPAPHLYVPPTAFVAEVLDAIADQETPLP